MKLHLVLVRTEFSGNIGASARALANMGGDRLILIDPRCEVDCSESRQMSAGARDTLAGAIVYGSWDEFYRTEGEGIRLALTRRAGKKRKVFPLTEILSDLAKPRTDVVGAEDPLEHLYLVLGPEADGLDVGDLAFTNYSCHLPVYSDFGSLNLAQAALLALHLVRTQFPPSAMPLQVTDEVEEAVQPFYFPDQLIKDWLTSMGFNVQARKASAYLTLRRLFLANRPTRHEVQVLEAILQQNIRKLREAPGASLGLATEELTDDVGEIPTE